MAGTVGLCGWLQAADHGTCGQVGGDGGGALSWVLGVVVVWGDALGAQWVRPSRPGALLRE
ncbi:hypothetical protein XFF6166_820012 [Xanthomonas citri pv. fuscans]|nr:hypothetical protein XFF6166_820012 [Xanthomonas citri pv. fuscans]SOO01623.1 hypothetical protein XFF6960_500012 [Xanthomonas citri pv. fuscans]SOO06267.1 hypothetical protein XFF7767_690012 [Xanthomonas citri pv. fuscans]SOO11481.1 hypothetical protein XFF6970_860011 [Xanthomonas citri pv. fuscans]SOO13192.1 hypothetical protein XFF7766_130012 [Xanthomonas citri pv. fuscans]